MFGIIRAINASILCHTILLQDDIRIFRYNAFDSDCCGRWPTAYIDANLSASLFEYSLRSTGGAKKRSWPYNKYRFTEEGTVT